MYEIVNKIYDLQCQMGYLGPDGTATQSIEDRIDYFRDITLALVKEVMEALDEVPWKPWRSIFEQSLNTKKAVYEICDILVFTIVLYLILESPISLEEAMGQTLAKIEKRIKEEGYGRKEKL